MESEVSLSESRSLRGRLKCFVYAWRGLVVLVTTQPNARIHLTATVLVGVAGIWLQLSPGEWGGIVSAIALVWITEGINTAIEFLVDLVSPERQKIAGWAKDVAAGAVLLASLSAAIIGLLILGPRLLATLRH